MNAAQIVEALGGRRGMVRCICHEDRTPSLKIDDGHGGRVLVKCFAGCDALDILAELRRRGLTGDGPAQSVARHHRPPAPKPGNDAWRRLWQETRPIPGTLGERHLEGRGLMLPPDCADIRFHPACPREGKRQPAVVWLLRDIRTDAPTAIQRRFLLPDGTKDGRAMSLGSCAGAVLKVTPDGEVTTGLALAEGYADALAVVGSGWRPCWATCGTTAMANFPMLGGVEALTIFADAGGPGIEAARQCADRWRAAGREVCIIDPPAGRKDFGELAVTA